MKSKDFLPNGLILYQDDAFFKLGQDSILLSAFAAPRRKDKVLDLGCGTGALALAVYRPDLTISGIELQEGALALFRRSIAENSVPITAIHGDIREIQNLIAHACMDYVVCNPPYFSVQSGKNAQIEAHSLSRQERTCTIEDVASACAFALRSGGRCAIVFRPERLWILLFTLSQQQLIPKRLRFVHQSAEKPPSVVMVECRKNSSPEGLIVEPPLIVGSDEFLKIYNK